MFFGMRAGAPRCDPITSDEHRLLVLAADRSDGAQCTRPVHPNRSLCRAPRRGAVGAFEWQVRLIVFAGTVGTAIGAFALPAFLMLFLRGIASFERTNSIPRTLIRALSFRTIVALAESLRVPTPSHLSRFSIRHVPLNLLVFNTIVTGIYAIGVVAAVYASVIDPAAARTSVLLSGIVNGIATISFTLIVDPTSAYITDQAAKGERPVEDVKSMVFFLSLTAILGTLLSQFILIPAAYVIAVAAHLFNAH